MDMLITSINKIPITSIGIKTIYLDNNRFILTIDGFFENSFCTLAL